MLKFCRVQKLCYILPKTRSDNYKVSVDISTKKNNSEVDMHKQFLALFDRILIYFIGRPI